MARSLLEASAISVAVLGVLLASAATTGGCDDDEGGTDAGADGTTSPCAAGFLGDPALAPQLEVRALTADGSDVALTDGGDLAVIFPPQGGRVAFVGVRANNVDGCALQVIGALRDPLSKQVRLDGRTVNLRREPDGWGATGRGIATDLANADDIGNYSNVPLCPNQWADRDVFDEPFELEVRIQDRGGRTATAKLTVTPRCAEPGAKETSCRCLCKKGYVLGEPCGEDAGVALAPGDTDGGTR